MMEKNEQNNEETIDNKKTLPFLSWLKRDFWVILVCLVAIFICLATYLNSANLISQCNHHCIKEFDTKCNIQFGNNKFPIINSGYTNFSIDIDLK